MKNIFKIVVVFLISIGLILLLKPFVEEYKDVNKYDFTLDTADGKISKDDLKGKVLAIYFGYTFCPDVCPTSLSSLSQALNSFDSKQVDNFVGLFISVDPKRDTLSNLKEYAKYFHKSFIGASSSKENIDDIVKRYDSYYEMVTLENSAIEYSVAHTSYIYIFDKDGKFVEKINHFSNPNKIKKVLENLL
ncbi:SCO family protein [Aliarcobacter vitoriensis]|uniref:SCO family protein n=1 Tax=Aliarcobacter vitoriensis TaxID=2011099 RepID=UPI003AAC49B7